MRAALAQQRRFYFGEQLPLQSPIIVVTLTMAPVQKANTVEKPLM